MAEQETNNLIKFYEKCESEGIRELSDPFSEKKAEQIASMMNIALTDGIQSVFSAAKEETRLKREEQKREAEIG